MGCHFLLQGIFSSQGSNLHLWCLLHCRQILYPLNHQGNLFKGDQPETSNHQESCGEPWNWGGCRVDAGRLWEHRLTGGVRERGKTRMTASWLEQLSGCGLFVKRKEKQISRFPLLCKECGFRVMTFKASIEYPQGNVQERVEYRN